MSAAPQLATDSARVLSCSIDEYFADPCERPSLSQSIANLMLKRSPLHAWTAHPRLGAIERPSTKAKDEGSLMHSLLLGRGAEVAIIEAKDFKTKAAQEQRDVAIAEGKLPVIASKYAAMSAAASKLRENMAKEGIVLDGASEVPIEFREDGQDGPVICRSLLDHVNFERVQIVDLKKITAADNDTCSRHAIDYGYDVQWAANTSALAKLMPEFAGHIDMVFVFLELEPPYAVVPRRPSGVLRERGERRWQRAVALWDHCLRTNRWPGYASGIVELEAPIWVLKEEELYSGSW